MCGYKTKHVAYSTVAYYWGPRGALPRVHSFAGAIKLGQKRYSIQYSDWLPTCFLASLDGASSHTIVPIIISIAFKTDQTQIFLRIKIILTRGRYYSKITHNNLLDHLRFLPILRHLNSIYNIIYIYFNILQSNYLDSV